MTLEDLWSLHERMAGILAARVKAKKRELDKRAAILNRSFANTDLTAGSHGERPRRSYPAVLPKYRNPKTSEAWSGRGKRPRWLTAAMKSGHKIEEFRISEVVIRNPIPSHLRKQQMLRTLQMAIASELQDHFVTESLDDLPQPLRAKVAILEHAERRFHRASRRS